MWLQYYIIICCGFSFCVTSLAQSLNNPHVVSASDNVYFSAFASPPKTLDPARSYEETEIGFLAQIYEPPLQYAYLKRPYAITPLVAMALPTLRYFDIHDRELPATTQPGKIAYTTYDIDIKPNVYYQPHPAFARDKQGKLRYQNLSPQQLHGILSLQDFQYTGSRELTAADFVYAIERLADPRISSPIYGVMSRYIVGLSDFRLRLQQELQQRKRSGVEAKFLDLRQFTFAGASIQSRYHYRIKIKGVYPQFSYWLTMPFFAPIPWEALEFYAQPYMIQHNLTLAQFPVGTGPYMLTKNNPNKEIILRRNPNFHDELFPSDGSQRDRIKGYLQLAGKPMPFIQQYSFSLEKESIPRWQKFLQGYYDRSSISPEGFDQAIQLNANGKPELTTMMHKKGIYLDTTVNDAIFFIGFNMLDPIVGGYSEQNRKLRQAIAIAVDYEEFIAIFLNGRGIPANGPLPPGIFGYQRGQAGINPYVYDWVNGRALRKSLAVAKQLLAEAGYPNGRNAKTGKVLVLNYDAPTTGGPDEASEFNWLRKQFAKLGISLNIRATLYNRFQSNVQNGTVQMFTWGWNSDYPDPENFLFLFYGNNGIVNHQGENTTNYVNPQFDALFPSMAQLPDGLARKQVIEQMVAILRADTPWIWGYYPINFILSHTWVAPVKPSAVANNLLKYFHINPQLRQQLLNQWNKPIFWPLLLMTLFFILLLLPLVITYYQRQHQPTIKRFNLKRLHSTKKRFK